MISLIESIYQNDDRVFVRAVVEDIILLYRQTTESPAEYGPALCESSFCLDDREILPTNEEELIQFLENLDLDWNILDNSDY